jgi:hypothetical protein
VPTDEKKTREENTKATAQQRDGEPKLRDILKREYDELLKGRARDQALDRWAEEIEGQVLRELEEPDLGPRTDS